ncbi:leucine-rich repeat-containing protein 59 [Tachysurus fulvidraco]|uniref:leucine-rich repeat-containing protein 59 n=1 Tax=Tachysurus fulvidraco TaxID=1234273 RepID=UPI000F505580|nr:leucine-rich repeat-containing protein 59 [Tachysurus fulvidraco]
MNKAKVESLRDKVDGNELDLSLCNLTEVPVKELAAVPKATVLDLSCNNLTTLTPDFCMLTHLVKVDLSKNQLVSLPEEIGQLSSLQHLDLYNNKLTMLPLSFCQLRSLKWLDLKDNPLEPTLAKAAGDCLYEKQCRQCAGQVLQHMKFLQEEADKERERRLLKEKEQEKKREARQKEREAREREAQKKKKAEEKERKRKEYEAQVAAQAAQEQQKKKKEEKKKRASQNQDKKKVSGPAPQTRRSACSRIFSLFLRIVFLLIVSTAAVIGTCRVTELKKEAFCAPVNLYTDEVLSWARSLDVVQQVMQKISDLQQ